MRPLHELTQRGVTVTRLTATGRAAFAAATRGVYDKVGGARRRGRSCALPEGRQARPLRHGA